METIIQPIIDYIVNNNVDDVTTGFVFAFGCWMMGVAVSSMCKAFTVSCDIDE